MSDFARVAAVSLRVHLGDVENNKAEILGKMAELGSAGRAGGRVSRTLHHRLYAG